MDRSTVIKAAAFITLYLAWMCAHLVSGSGSKDLIDKDRYLETVDGSQSVLYPHQWSIISGKTRPRQLTQTKEDDSLPPSEQSSQVSQFVKDLKQVSGKGMHRLEQDKRGVRLSGQKAEPFVRERTIYLPGQFPTTTRLSDALPGARSTIRHVPKIIHQIHFEGHGGLKQAMNRTKSSLNRLPPVEQAWLDRCKELHPGWEFRMWNATAMEEFIAKHYGWFLDTYQSYPKDIYRVDAIRPFILDKYGGVYIDTDTECFRPIDSFLQGHELILQEEDLGLTSLVNCAIAGAPDLFFWKIWQRTLKIRAPKFQVPIMPDKLVRNWEVVSVINSTGPWALRSAFRSFTANHSLIRDNFVGAWIINNTNVMVYPAGAWFVPCYWNDAACHDEVEMKQRAGGEFPIWLAGHHKNSGSWFKAVGYARPIYPNWGNWKVFFLCLILILGGAWLWRRSLMRHLAILRIV